MVSALYTGVRQLVEARDLDQVLAGAAQAGVATLGAQMIALGQTRLHGQFHLPAHAPAEASPRQTQLVATTRPPARVSAGRRSDPASGSWCWMSPPTRA